MAEDSNNEEGTTSEASSTSQVPYHELFSFADAADHSLMVIGAITAVGSGLCLPLMTLVFGELADSFGHNVETRRVAQEVSKISLKYVYLALGSSVATFSQVSCWMITGERQVARIRSLYLRAVLRQDIGYFDTEAKTGEIIERISSDSVIIQDAMSEKVGKFIQLSASFFGGIVVAFIKGWLLASVLLSAIPLLVVSAAFMTVLITKFTARGQNSYSEAAVVVEQTITSIRNVASFTGEKRAIDKYEKSLHGAYKAGVEIGLAAGVGSGVFMLILFCSYALAIWFGAIMIIEKGYTGGDVLNVTMAILMGSFSFGMVSPCLSSFAAGRVAAAKLFQTIHRKPEIDPYSTKGLILNDLNGDLELRNVDFSYPSRPNERVLIRFSLTVPSGTTLALVGESGSGKSTVINLVERFYDPQSGEVLIDGINIKEFQLKWMRGKIGLVSQEPVLFAATIKENIAYGTKGATLEEIRIAADVANAANFIDKLPQGLETMVGAKGSQLSGGQKQRIALARAVLKDARILLLDEATSALDAESEKIVKEALDRVFISRTTLVVAHRLSTVKNADSIAVIHQGKIAEKGTHSELMQSVEGVYKHLTQLQELKKDSSSTASRKGSSTTEHIINTSSLSISSHLEKHKTPPSSSLPKSKEKVPFHRLANLNKPELPQLILGSIAAAVNGAVLPIFGLIYSGAIKSLYEPPHNLRKQSKFWTSMFIILGVASLLATPLKTYSFAVAGSKLIRRIRLMCFHKLVHMEIGYFDKPQNSKTAVASRLSADATSVRSLVGDSAAVLVQNISTAISGLIIAFGASWELTLIVLPMLPLIGLNGYLHMKFVNGFAHDTKKLYEDASEVASEAVSSIRTVASFCGEDKVMELYQEKCEVPVKLGTKQALISGASFGLSLFFLYSVYAASYYAGARLVDAGKINFGDVFRVFLGLSMTASAISQSGALAPDSSTAHAGAASVFALLDHKVEIDSSSNTGRRIENMRGDIIFKHVSFGYPIRPGVQVLKDLCLTIHAGKTVAVVGESGSGKSTVISLVQRFYDPDSGGITVDGVGIREVNLKWWRQQMGMVSQEPLLFNDTIRANIAYGKEGEAMEAEIVAAANLSNAHTFITAMDKGYETMVGERGVQLSGGQKQRVAIARAIVKSPRILLLDEATSALDAESEKVVQEALDRLAADRTTLVVAHRLSTIKNADVIAVLKDGVIVEKGKHESLMNMKDGIYATLVALHGLSS